MTVHMADFPALLDALHFDIVAQDDAVGEVAGIPTTLTVLAVDPLAVMFAFRLDPDCPAIGPHELPSLDHIPDERASISFEDGVVWLSLYDLSALTIDDLTNLVHEIAQGLAEANWAPAPGCMRCGTLEGAQLVYSAGRVSRICSDCLSTASQKQQALNAQAQRGTVAATFNLPGAVAYVATGWAIFWLVVGFLLKWFGIQVIELNKLTNLFLMLLSLGMGFALGWPLGSSVRRSIGLRRAPILTSAALVLAAVVASEIGYVAVRIWLLVGKIELLAAAQLLAPVLASYSGFWISCKLVLAATILGCCIVSARNSQSVPLEI